MQPFFTFSEAERETILATLKLVRGDPYQDFSAFSAAVSGLIENNEIPSFFRTLCAKIRMERENGISDAHVLLNCPSYVEVSHLELGALGTNARVNKNTFINEAFLALFSQLINIPLLLYGRANNADLKNDTIAANLNVEAKTKFGGMDMICHNNCCTASVASAGSEPYRPQDIPVYTGFVDGV